MLYLRLRRAALAAYVERTLCGVQQEAAGEAVATGHAEPFFVLS